MATIEGTKTVFSGFDNGDQKFSQSVDFFWEGMGDDDTGTYFSFSGLADKTVTISGTIGAGTVTIQGSNDAVTWFTLNSAIDGTELDVSAAEIAVILENPLYIRPITDSGSSNDVDVHILARLTV